MSYIRNVKNLLSDDLKGLISHFTGFKEGSPEFKKCEASAWSLILDRHYPSVNEHRVKTTLWDFVDKFKVHGFPQKAQNLKMLIELYSKLPYFKKFSNTEVQWGLIDFLIKLSFKPTNCLVDDPPLDLTKKPLPSEDAFDWVTYLKEGLDKFRLIPEDEASLSDWSNDEEEEEKAVDGDARREKDVVGDDRQVLSLPGAKELREAAARHADLVATVQQDLAEKMWWHNPKLREIPPSHHPEANYCLFWEKSMNLGPETRILNEYKVLRELIYVLGMPTSCYFIMETTSGEFKTIPKISISSLSPDVFSTVIDQHFCKYLPSIRKLIQFCSDMDQTFTSNVPSTYRAYSGRLKKLLHKYYRKLLDIERRVDAQEDISTLMYLKNETSSFMNQFEYLSELHDKLIPEDWRQKDRRLNSFRLVSVLQEELGEPSLWRGGERDWLMHTLLLLLVDALQPFLVQLAQHMTGYPNSKNVDEFFLTSAGEITVSYANSSSREFWEPILKAASSALASCAFLLQFERYTNFFKNGHRREILFVKFVEKLCDLMVYKPLNFTNDDYIVQDFNFDDHFLKEVLDGSRWGCIMKESMAPPKIFRKTASDRLGEVLNDVHLSAYDSVTYCLQKGLESVIEEYMEPKGFAAEILLNELHLLEHLRAMFSSLQANSALSTVLITEVQGPRYWKRLIFDFENYLSDILCEEYVQNFKLNINPLSLQRQIQILDVPDYIKLDYVVDSQIKSVISKETIDGYAMIFCFLLKIRLALTLLTRLNLKSIEETSGNCLRLRRLCSLRIWIIHAMSTLSFYFSTFSDLKFQEKMKNLCLNARKICTIHEAHLEFIEKWKYHCFLTDGNPCYDNILQLLSICRKLNKYWEMEEKGQLADSHLASIEASYCEAMANFALSLQLKEDRLVDADDTFSFLYGEVINNLPSM